MAARRRCLTGGCPVGVVPASGGWEVQPEVVGVFLWFHFKTTMCRLFKWVCQDMGLVGLKIDGTPRKIEGRP